MSISVPGSVRDGQIVDVMHRIAPASLKAASDKNSRDGRRAAEAASQQALKDASLELDSSASFVYHGGGKGLRFHALCRPHSARVQGRKIAEQMELRRRLVPESATDPLPQEIYDAWIKARSAPQTKAGAASCAGGGGHAAAAANAAAASAAADAEAIEAAREAAIAASAAAAAQTAAIAREARLKYQKEYRQKRKLQERAASMAAAGDQGETEEEGEGDGGDKADIRKITLSLRKGRGDDENEKGAAAEPEAQAGPSVKRRREDFDYKGLVTDEGVRVIVKIGGRLV
jgi:hypothetical protein